MKPKRILLIRHGESEGNADRSQYETTPDFMLNLTSQGLAQAKSAGSQLKMIVGVEKIYAYISPFYRTRQTFEEIANALPSNIVRVIEDPRLRELDWGHLRPPDENEDIISERNNFSPFYYRIPDGESGADVYDRVSTFLETLYRDFTKPDYPDNTLIVTHGMTLRLFLMRWFHWSIEEFESLKNPKNCQIIVMERSEDTHYRLTSTLEKRNTSI